jgi:hypothetical protein
MACLLATVLARVMTSAQPLGDSAFLWSLVGFGLAKLSPRMSLKVAARIDRSPRFQTA